jgi:rubredoxin
VYVKPAQSTCPHCRALSDRLEVLSRQFMYVNYFRCPQCSHVWKAAKSSAERNER